VFWGPRRQNNLQPCGSPVTCLYKRESPNFKSPTKLTTRTLCSIDFHRHFKMLSTAHRRAALLLACRARAPASISSTRALLMSSRASSNTSVPNVSKTNELPHGKQQEDDVLVHESVEDAEKLRVMQEPNRATTWSRSQKPRGLAMTGPRFEQTIVELQVSMCSN
jgi:hypothetical protein